MSVEVQPAENDDLLDQIFGAEIHLPEVKTTGKFADGEVTKTVKVTEESHYEKTNGFSSTHEEKIIEQHEVFHHESSHQEFKEVHEVEAHTESKIEGHDTEEEDKTEEHLAVEDEHIMPNIAEESSRYSSDSETETSETIVKEHAEGEDKDEEEHAYEVVKPRQKDKLAPLRSPIQDQLIAEMREKQNGQEKEDYYEQIVEEDVPLGDDTNQSYEDSKENGAKLEEKAESFLEYDKIKRAEVMEEKISEPNFDIDMKSEDYDHELAKFDERAGLESTGSHMAESVQNLRDDDADKKSIQFSDLPMDSENKEIHWEHTDGINNSMFYNDNIVLKRSEKFSMHRERESSDAAASEGYQNSEADKHVVYSTVAESKETINNNQDLDEEALSGPGVQNLRSLFESGSKNTQKKTGHPPQKVHEVYGHFDTIEPQQPKEVPQQKTTPVPEPHHEEHHDKEPVRETFVPSVEHEEQKPVNELLNMFGGRKQPTPKKEVPKTVVHKVDRPINRVPAIRSRASSVSSEKDKAVEQTGKAALPSLKHKMRSPIFTSKDQFQSVRVVKNVRQFVKIWGRAPYTPDSPHPMSPVYTSYDTDYLSQEKPHVLKPTASRRSSVANLTNIFSGQHENAQSRATEHVEDVEPEMPAKTQQEIESEAKVETAPHIISAMDKIEDVQIDDIPVSERRKMFEKNVPKRKDSQADKHHYGGRQVAQVKAVVREEPVEEVLKPEKEQTSIVEEITNDTEEMKDYITNLIPVSQRRKMFEAR
uniref:Cardiomyopathy-associated protein 5 n=1 Tax=Syphacia muris TaxID=451379 RepID=A0A0N5A7L7_9BILA